MADTPQIAKPAEAPMIVRRGSFTDSAMVSRPSLESHQDSMSPTREVTFEGQQRKARSASQSHQNNDRRVSREPTATESLLLSPHSPTDGQDHVRVVSQDINEEDDTLSASMAIDAYTCAFDISRDGYFLWEIQNVMKCIEQKDPKVKDDLSAVYKFAYSGSQVSNDVAEEVLRGMKAYFETAKANQIPPVWSTLNGGQLYRLCYTLSLVKQLKSCFLEAKLHLPHQCVFEYIAIGCPNLRSIKSSLQGLNSANLRHKASERLLNSIKPSGPTISDRQLQAIYRTLGKLKQAQKLYHDAWRVDDSITASWTGVDARNCREDADRLIASAKGELAKEPMLEDPKEVETQKRFHLMCSLIEQSARDEWDYGLMMRWLKFWERMKVE